MQNILYILFQAYGLNELNLIIAILLIIVNILLFIGVQQSKGVLVIFWLVVMGIRIN